MGENGRTRKKSWGEWKDTKKIMGENGRTYTKSWGRMEGHEKIMGEKKNLTLGMEGPEKNLAIGKKS